MHVAPDPVKPLLPLIDGARLWRRHQDMARHGATARGGVNRGALDDADISVHVNLAHAARERGFAVAIDDYGNQFMRRAGSERGAAPVVAGSHSDSQPSGGRFDGIYGVLAAFEALETIDDAGIVTRHPVEAVIWNNEEGRRFTPTAMGSAVYTGAASLERMLAARDADGVSMAEAVARLRTALPDAAPRRLGSPLAAFVEAHIEQGPVLEDEGLTIGVVTGIQGTRKFEVEVHGEEAHAGTTPRARRRDALLEAARVLDALERLFHDDAGLVRFTVGRFTVHPNATAVVPGRVRFSIDFRHPEVAVLDRLGHQVAATAQAATSRCDVVVDEPMRAAPVVFEGVVPEAIERAVRRRAFGWRRMPSGAGHDARYVAGFCPTGMIFVPCAGGISHNERESAEPTDLAAGTQVLSDTLLELAGV